jgi:hypothetical protein
MKPQVSFFIKNRIMNTPSTLLKRVLIAFLFCVFATINVQAAIGLRGTSTANSNNATLTVARPAGVVSGDLLIITIAQNGTGGLSNPTSAGWTLISGANLGGGTDRRGIVLYKMAGAAEPANYTFALDNQSDGTVGTIAAFSGVDLANPFDVASGNLSVQNSNTALLATAKTTITANSAVVMLGMAANSSPTFSTWAAASMGNLTEFFDNRNNNNAAVGGAWAIKATPGTTGAGTAVLSAAERNAGIILVLRPIVPTTPTITNFTPTTACVGGTVVITGTNFTTATAVRFNGTAAAFTVNSATQITTTVPAGATSGTITVTNPLGTATSSTVFTLATSGPAAATAISGNTSVCQGQNSVTYTLPVIANAASYVWSYSGTGATITGNTNTITIAFSATATAGNLSVYGVNSCGNGTTSSLPITVNSLPTAAGPITGPASLCRGITSQTYSIPAIAGATSYVWAYSGTGATITGTGNSISISFSATATSGNLTVYGLNACGNGVVATRAITLTAITTPMLEFTFGQNDTTYTIFNMCGTIAGGGQNDIDIASGNPGGSATYQWQVSYNNGVSWTNAPGPTALTTEYVLSPAYSTFLSVAGVYNFRLIITNNGCPVISNTVTLTVILSSNLTSGTITGNQSYCALSADPTALTQTAAPVGGNGAFTYQWQSSADGVNFLNIAGATAATYNPPVITQTTYYRRVVVTGGCGAYSNIITVAVGAPTITTSTIAPLCASTAAQTATLPYTAITGAATTYSISWNANPANSFAAVTNAAIPANAFTIPVPANTPPGTYTGNLTIRNAGNCVSAITTFTITIQPVLAAPVISASGPLAICAGNSVTLTSSIPNGNLWSTGATTQSITVFGAGTYVAYATAANSCTSSASNSIAVTVGDVAAAPVVDGTTELSCSASNGTISLSNLPAGNWTLNQTGPVNATITGNTSAETIIITQAGQYSFTVTNASGCSSPATALIQITGTATTEWNGTSWSNGIPTDEMRIVFSGSYTSAGNLEGCSCLVTAGDVVFSNGTVLTLTNGLTVAGGSMTFENNASLIQLSDNALNSGEINYKRNAFVRNLDYVYWSSPVANFNINNLSTVVASGPIYQWNPTVANTNNGQGNWEGAAGAIMTSGKGYIVRGPGAFGATAQNFEATFVGTPNNGEINVTIARGFHTGASYFGNNGTEITNLSDNSNLIGNPYPSAIRASQFLFDNQATIEGAVRLWTHGTLPSVTNNPNYGSFTYNYSPNDYLTYNFTGSNCCPAADADLFIGAGQGFFVQMKDGPEGTADLIFNNGLRNTNYSNATFFRNGAAASPAVENLERNRIWLDIVNAEGQSERTLIGYIEGATNGVDSFYDAQIPLPNAMSIYTSVGEIKTNIQGRALPFDQNDSVAVGFKAMTAGNYSLAIGATDGLFDAQNIYLEDTELGIIHDLKQAPYHFSAAAGNHPTRFVLRYNNSGLSVGQFNPNEVVASINNHELHVSAPNTINHIQLIDLSGKIILDSAVNELEFNHIVQAASGVYIAKIQLENGQIISKKIVN